MQTLRGRRILVVEDEALIAMHLEDAVADAGAVVVGPVATVTAALDVLAHDPHLDAAVLDLNLADEPSEPIALALAEQGVPYLIATGCNDGFMPAAEQQAAGILTKPYDVLDLVTKLAAICGQEPTAC